MLYEMLKEWKSEQDQQDREAEEAAQLRADMDGDMLMAEAEEGETSGASGACFGGLNSMPNAVKLEVKKNPGWSSMYLSPRHYVKPMYPSPADYVKPKYPSPAEQLASFR